MVVDGDVPFMLGKDSLREHDAVESHGKACLQMNVGDRQVRFETPVSKHDGHARIILSSKSIMHNVAESLMVNHSNLENSDVEAERLIQKIHDRTHLHVKSMELLLRRSGSWKPVMSGLMKQIVGKCHVCLRCGDPEPSKKFSLSKLHKEFNDRVCFDIMYWQGRAILHLVDYATGFSELSAISSRELPHIVQVMQNIWLLRHGTPVQMIGDMEFDKSVMQKWAHQNCIQFNALPARRHNKAGAVERKNRVVKDVLEKLSADRKYKGRPLKDRLAAACYISNIMYGNSNASSFELARGYTPSVEGTEQKLLPEKYRVAYKEMCARRLLAKIMKARPSNKRAKDIRVGDSVLILVPGGDRPRGKWMEARVASVRQDGSIVCGTGRNAKTIASEDVRTIPSNSIAASVIRAQHGIPAARHERIRVAKEYDYEDCASSSSDEDSDTSSPDDEIPETEDSSTGTVVGAPDSGVPRASAVQAVEPPAAPVEEQNIQSAQAPRRSARIRKPNPRYIESMLVNPMDKPKTEQDILGYTFDAFRNVQFYGREAPWVPSWIFSKAEQEEVTKNWVPNIEVIAETKIPKNANIIGSHFVYKVKSDIDDKDQRLLKLKARLCVHGNRDAERDSLRTDAAVVSHEGFRMAYSICVSNGFVLGKADIRGAYTQSGQAVRQVYVQPPRCLGAKGTFWLLKATFYGLVSAGRKWQRTSDEVLINLLGLSVVVGMPQLFNKFENGLVLTVAKYVDDLLVVARNSWWLSFARGAISQSFDVSQWAQTPSTLQVNSTDVDQHADSITVAMTQYAKAIETIQIPPARRKQITESVSKLEERQVRTIAGRLGYMGVAVSPFCAFSASFMQQSIPEMTIGNLKQVNALIRETMKRYPALVYLKPGEGEEKQARIVAYSDAGYPHSGKNKKVAQEGCLVGIAFGSKVGSVFHTLTWMSRKQRRASTSSASAETMAAVMAFGCALGIAMTYANATGVKLPISLVVDSRGLHRCLATQSHPRDRAVMTEVHNLRMCYESGMLDSISWLPGVRNPADALTKPRSGDTSDILERMLTEGRLIDDIDNIRDYGAALAEEE